jgi:hypothetical protein
MIFSTDYRFTTPKRLQKPFRLPGVLTACWLSLSTCWAQSFQFKSTVNAVHQTGFHRILLPPDVVGRLNETLTDIRLYDSQQREVPYKLLRQQPTQNALFVDYELVNKQVKPNAATTMVVRNRAKSPISSLSLIVKNTNVGKKARLSGSSDGQSWYAIDDAIWLEPTTANITTAETKQIDFPLSDYEYYRLEVNDSLSTPLNILRLGHYRPMASAVTYTAIPNLAVSQRDSSDKRSYVHLTRPTNARLDKLTVVIQASTPFRRRAELGQFRSRKRKRGRVEQWFEVVRSVELSSSDSNVVYLPSLKTNDLYLVIANDDNPPIEVSSVRAYQLTTYLIANLTAGQSYQVRFSATDASTPAYDMTPFKGNFISPVVDVGEVVSTNADRAKTASFFTDRRIIWPALGVVLLVLGLLSYRMIREMGGTNPQSF